MPRRVGQNDPNQEFSAIGDDVRRRRVIAGWIGVLGIVGGALWAGLGSIDRSPAHDVPFPVTVGPRLDMKMIARTKSSTGGATALSLHSTSLVGAVAQQPKVYLVFWGSQWGAQGALSATGDPKNVAPALQTFFANLYGSNDTWGTTLSQYCAGIAIGSTSCPATGVQLIQHPTTSILAGVWFDTASAAPAAATQAQLGAEAIKAAVALNGSSKNDPNAQYVIASPSRTNPNKYKTGGFCAWHSSVSSSSYPAVGTVAYTNMPYLPDLGASACTTHSAPQPLDGYFSTETHEYAETVTDMWPSAGWLASGGSEIGDLCVNLDGYQTMAGVKYDVQGIWSNAVKGCVTNGT